MIDYQKTTNIFQVLALMSVAMVFSSCSKDDGTYTYIKQEAGDTIMKWSALREKEGGERFTTTFTWKRVK